MDSPALGSARGTTDQGDSQKDQLGFPACMPGQDNGQGNHINPSAASGRRVGHSLPCGGSSGNACREVRMFATSLTGRTGPAAFTAWRSNPFTHPRETRNHRASGGAAFRGTGWIRRHRNPGGPRPPGLRSVCRPPWLAPSAGCAVLIGPSSTSVPFAAERAGIAHADSTVTGPTSALRPRRFPPSPSRPRRHPGHPGPLQLLYRRRGLMSSIAVPPPRGRRPHRQPGWTASQARRRARKASRQD